MNNETRNNNNNARAVSEFLNEYMNAIYHISLESLFEAYWDCRKNKARTMSASEFEVHYESNLIELHREITAGTYTQRPSITFVITKPDYREIFASHFRDRIVHHWIRQRIVVQRHCNVQKKICINDICDELKCSKSTLLTTFKKTYGITVNTYITEARLERAVHLLIEGNMTISEIAVETGFSDQSYFSKVFSASYGISPSEYRGERRK